MTVLELSELRLQSQAGAFDGPSASVTGKRIALVGRWGPVWSVLCGRAAPTQGALLVDGQDARVGVLAGQVGVADPELAPLAVPVTEWIATYLRLGGASKRDAHASAARALERLGLKQLGVYTADRLPTSSLYAVRLALAFATEPRCVFAPPPAWTSDSMALEGQVLGQLAAQTDLLLACDPGQHPELFAGCDQALVLEAQTARATLPGELYQRGARHYCLVVLDQREALVRELSRSGAVVWNPEGEGELWVRLPAGQGSALVVQSAVTANSPLARMTPLFESAGWE
jgi:hypothetical protein